MGLDPPAKKSSVLPCGKGGAKTVPKEGVTLQSPPPKPAQKEEEKEKAEYELMLQVVENNKEKKKVTEGITIRDLNLVHPLGDKSTFLYETAIFDKIKDDTSHSFEISKYDTEKYKVKSKYGPFKPVLKGSGASADPGFRWRSLHSRPTAC